jgi:hypothetical protein
VGPSSQRQYRAASCPDWLPWAALSGHAHGGLNVLPTTARSPRLSRCVPTAVRRPTAARSFALPLVPPSQPRHVPTAAVPSRRRPVRTMPPTSTLAVPPDATIYAVVSCRRPRAGEPRHAFPDHLPCAGKGATLRQACRAVAACCATVCAAPWAALAASANAELGYAQVAMGRARAVPWAEPTPRAWAKCTVYLSRAWFRPSGSRSKFSIFRIYSIPCKFKNLCRIHLNSENYETNFLGKVLICTRF